MVAGDGRTVDVGVTVSSFRRLEQYTCQSLNRVRNEGGLRAKLGTKKRSLWNTDVDHILCSALSADDYFRESSNRVGQ